MCRQSRQFVCRPAQAGRRITVWCCAMLLTTHTFATTVPRCTDRRVTIHAQKVLLGVLLQDLSVACALRVSGTVDGQTRVSLALDAVKVELALAQILRGHNYILQRASGVEHLYLLDRGQGMGRLSERAPYNQVAAAIDLPVPGGAAHAEVLPPASTDGPLVREAALRALAHAGPALDPALVLPALSDAAPAVRELAIDILATLTAPRALHLLRQAAGDDDTFVREAALEALAERAAKREN